jgi:hypothetical protein
LFWIWFAASVVVALIAAYRGRRPVVYFLLSLVLSPILMGLIALIAPARATTRTHVACPDCRTLVARDARACAHCGCKLTPQ